MTAHSTHRWICLLGLFAVLSAGALEARAGNTALLTEETRINATPANESVPRLGADIPSLKIVVYSRDNGVDPIGVFYQRITDQGQPIGPEVRVSRADADKDSLLADISGNNIVYIERLSFDQGFVVLYEIDTGFRTPLSSPQDLREVGIHGTNVVWTEASPGGASAVFLTNLSDIGNGIPPRLLAGPLPPGSQVDIGDRLVLWEVFNGTDNDIQYLDLATGLSGVLAGTALDEREPASSGPWAVWRETVSVSPSATRIRAANLDLLQLITVIDDGNIHLNPSIDGDIIAWDGTREPFGDPNFNFDIFLHRISMGETFQVTVTPGHEQLSNVFGNQVAYVASRDGNLDVFVTTFDFVPIGRELLVGSNFSDSVLRYDAATGAFIDAVVPSGSGGLNAPWEAIFGPDGNLYVSSSLSDSVLRYDGRSGAFIDDFVPSQSGGLITPHGLVFGPGGNLYVSGANTDGVLRYHGTSGAFIDAFVPPLSGGLTGPSGLAFGPDGNLYVSAFGNDSVLRYDGTSGAFIDAFVPAGSGGLDEPHGLIFGPDGNLYVASAATTGGILRYDGTTGAFIDAFVPAGSGGLLLPTGLAFGFDGDLYVGSLLGEVLRYDGTSGAFIDAHIPAGRGGLDGAMWPLFTAPEIAVAPLSHDFGDVLVGGAATTVVTVSNLGRFDLSISGIALGAGSDGSFSVTLAPPLPLVLPPGRTADVEVSFTPAGAGAQAAALEIASDDLDEGLVTVALSGAGVLADVPPLEQIVAILDFMDAEVAAGNLFGSGPGNSAAKRLNALRNQVAAAGDLIASGLIDDACQQLLDALRRTDGVPRPPDFVSGPAASQLKALIEGLRTDLGCP